MAYRCSLCHGQGHTRPRCPDRPDAPEIPERPPAVARSFERWARDVGARLECVDLPADHPRREQVTRGMRLVARAPAPSLAVARRMLDRAERDMAGA